MNILKRIVFISLIIIGCGSNGDNSDSSKLQVTLIPSGNMPIGGKKGMTITLQPGVFVTNETGSIMIPDVEVTITSSVPPPTVVLRSEEEVSASSSLVVYTDGFGSALFFLDITIDEEMEILITASVNSSTDSLNITVEPW